MTSPPGRPPDPVRHLRGIAIIRHGLTRHDEDILTGTTPTKINQQAARLAQLDKEHP